MNYYKLINLIFTKAIDCCIVELSRFILFLQFVLELKESCK